MSSRFILKISTAPSSSGSCSRTMDELKNGSRSNGTARLEATWDVISGAFGRTGQNDDESVCIQCVNRENLTFAKAEKDISKVLKAVNGTPHHFRIVARSNISAEMRDSIKKHVKTLGARE